MPTPAAPAQQPATAARQTRRDRLIVVDDFLPAELAEAMRGDIDRHFGEPNAHAPKTHQVWNYWHVPELYTYLRTQPENLIGQDKTQAFFNHLQRWSVDALGLSRVTWPYLSLYVSGCVQGLHNDAGNGRFGFVYSLTRNERKSTGGQTIVHHAGDPVRAMLSKPSAGSSFYDLVEPRFNRLVLFDDRMPHAVTRVEGSMDPLQGRFVLHGHIGEGQPLSLGPLPIETLVAGASKALEAVSRATFIDGYHGPVVFRLTIEADGSVGACDVVLDRVLSVDAQEQRWPGILGDLAAGLAALSFPATSGPTTLLLPVSFGQPPKAS
jgi:hypothetical protein